MNRKKMEFIHFNGTAVINGGTLGIHVKFNFGELSC